MIVYNEFVVIVFYWTQYMRHMFEILTIEEITLTGNAVYYYFVRDSFISSGSRDFLEWKTTSRKVNVMQYYIILMRNVEPAIYM